MKFKPKSEKELSEANLWPKRDYAYEILEADEAEDKNGNGMIKLKVKVYNDENKSQNIFDYVSGSWMEHKLRHLAEETNLLADYESGELNAYDLVGKTGWCRLGVSVDKTGQYPDKNSILDYNMNAKAKPSNDGAVTDDSDIPF